MERSVFLSLTILLALLSTHVTGGGSRGRYSNRKHRPIRGRSSRPIYLGFGEDQGDVSYTSPEVNDPIYLGSTDYEEFMPPENPTAAYYSLPEHGSDLLDNLEGIHYLDNLGDLGLSLFDSPSLASRDSLFLNDVPESHVNDVLIPPPSLSLPGEKAWLSRQEQPPHHHHHSIVIPQKKPAKKSVKLVISLPGRRQNQFPSRRSQLMYSYRRRPLLFYRRPARRPANFILRRRIPAQEPSLVHRKQYLVEPYVQSGNTLSHLPSYAARYMLKKAKGHKNGLHFVARSSRGKRNSRLSEEEDRANHADTSSTEVLSCQGHRYLLPRLEAPMYGCCGNFTFFWPQETCVSKTLEIVRGRHFKANLPSVRRISTILICDGAQHRVQPVERHLWGCCGKQKYDITREMCDIISARPAECPPDHLCCDDSLPVLDIDRGLRCCPGVGSYDPMEMVCELTEDDYYGTKKRR